MKKKVVGSMSELSGMLKDFFRQIDDGSITLQQLQSFIEHKNPFAPDNSIESWQDLYRTYFNTELDFSNLRIPARKESFDRLIIVAQGITPQIIFNQCRKLLPCDKSDEINLEAVKSERTSKKAAYAVWFRERVEADDELRGLSASNLKDRSEQGITLEERLLFELKYFIETSKHLDIRHYTICAGSRYRDDYVPIVNCHQNHVDIGIGYSRWDATFAGSRQAIL